MSDDPIDPTSKEITELGIERADEYTERILAFIEDIEKTCSRPFIPLLVDIALMRAYIVHLVRQYGAERGLREAREGFEAALEELRPMIQNMDLSKGNLPQ